MPLYEFKCHSCGTVTEQRSTMDSIPASVSCQSCGMESRRKISMPGVIMRPEGYSLSPSDPNYSKGIAEASNRKVHKWQLS